MKNKLQVRIEEMSDAQLKRVFKTLDAKYNEHTDDERLVWDNLFDAAWQRDIIRIGSNDEIVYVIKEEVA